VTAAAFVAAMAWVPGCIEPDRPVVHATTLEEVDAVQREREAAIRDLLADVSMTVEGLEHSGSFSVSMQYQPADRFRLVGMKGMLTIFSFVMVGERYHLHMPTENKVVVGNVKEQRGKHPELEATFSWLSEKPEAGQVRSLEETPAGFEIVTRRDGRVVRRAALEKRTLFVTSVRTYGPDGKEKSLAEMSDYRESKPPAAFPGPSAWLPRRLAMTGTADDGKPYAVKAKLSLVYLNEGLEPDVFDMTIPEGVTVEDAR
jgi:hypothetical protein